MLFRSRLGHSEMLIASEAWQIMSSCMSWGSWAMLPGPLAREEPAGLNCNHTDIWTGTLCVRGFSLEFSESGESAALPQCAEHRGLCSVAAPLGVRNEVTRWHWLIFFTPPMWGLLAAQPGETAHRGMTFYSLPHALLLVGRSVREGVAYR